MARRSKAGKPSSHKAQITEQAVSAVAAMLDKRRGGKLPIKITHQRDNRLRSLEESTLLSGTLIKRPPVLEDQVIPVTAANKGNNTVALPSTHALRKRVVDLCAKRGISQMKLSTEIGRSKSYVGLIWGGHVSPNDDLIKRMSDVLGEDLLPLWQGPTKPETKVEADPNAGPAEDLGMTEAAKPIPETLGDALVGSVPFTPLVVEEPTPSPAPAPAVTNAVERLIAEHGRKSNISVSRMTVTPEMAQIFLMANKGNRQISRPHLQWLARQITAGEWDPDNGEMVKFAPDGELIDGQHRLNSIIIAKKPIDIDVAYGVPKKSQATIDVGRQRSIGDQLHINGEANAKHLSAAIRWVYAISSGVITYKTSTVQVQDFIKRFPEIRESTALVRQGARGVTPTLLIAMHFIIWKGLSDRALADLFVKVFVTGEPNYSGDPVFRAREIYRDAREKGQHVSQFRQMENLIHALNLFRKGQSVKGLRLPKGRVKIDGYTPSHIGIEPGEYVSLKTTTLSDGTRLMQPVAGA